MKLLRRAFIVCFVLVLTLSLTAASQTAAKPDPCTAKAHCDSNKTFSAEIVQLTASMVGSGRHHYLKMTVRFRNLTDHPVILAYVTGTSSAVDELGNTYAWGRPATHDTSAQGIGVVEGRKADTQFQLDPGESRNADLGVIRFNAGRKPLGHSFNFSTTIAELQHKGSVVESVRQYRLTFPHLPDKGW